MSQDDKLLWWIGGIAAAYILAERRTQKKPALIFVEGKPLGFRAITVPPVGILVSKQYAHEPDILEHELEHWRQAQRLGVIGFYASYLSELLTQGYPCMPMEVQARQAAYEATGVKHPIYGIQPNVCTR
jgi:hypothetical protein